MLLMRKSVPWSHMTVILWAALWMLAAPLVHIHPEADHHHGEARHVHGGIVHMVFSPDLDGEYDGHHTTGVREHSAASHLTLAGHSSHTVAHNELTLSFLNDSTERKPAKPLFTSALTAEHRAINEYAPPLRVAQPCAGTLLFKSLTSDIPSRAPPPHFI